jgi:hypothetical protein
MLNWVSEQANVAGKRFYSASPPDPCLFQTRLAIAFFKETCCSLFSTRSAVSLQCSACASRISASENRPCPTAVPTRKKTEYSLSRRRCICHSLPSLQLSCYEVYSKSSRSAANHRCASLLRGNIGHATLKIGQQIGARPPCAHLPEYSKTSSACCSRVGYRWSEIFSSVGRWSIRK